MMPADPLVSVSMPARDAALYISEAIESVIAQDLPQVEVLVVDDGSTDGTAEIAESFGDPVRVERQDAQGEAAARNRCLRMARGSIFAFLDADDIWPANKLDLQLGALDRSDVDVVFGRQLQFRSPELNDDVVRFAGEGEVVQSALAGVMVVGRSDFERVGPYRDFSIATTMDWLVRARELGLRELQLPDVVLQRRLHPGGHSRKYRDQFGDYARILKASLDRRREGR
jgi:glycosyltransferase involved in cell wall biosynthesis